MKNNLSRYYKDETDVELQELLFVKSLKKKWMIDDEDRNCLIHRSLNSLLHEIKYFEDHFHLCTW